MKKTCQTVITYCDVCKQEIQFNAYTVVDIKSNLFDVCPSCLVPLENISRFYELTANVKEAHITIMSQEG